LTEKQTTACAPDVFRSMLTDVDDVPRGLAEANQLDDRFHRLESKVGGGQIAGGSVATVGSIRLQPAFDAASQKGHHRQLRFVHQRAIVRHNKPSHRRRTERGHENLPTRVRSR
jgi:hypothetical protein